MIKRLKFLLWGLLLVPFTLSSLYHLPYALSSLKTQLDSLIFISFGILGYILFEAIFAKPMRTYVFGHELTHALAALAMGGKVHRFSVSKKGGSVSLSKSNFLVALAPYCIPIYTVTVLLVYSLLSFWFVRQQMDLYFLFAWASLWPFMFP